MKATTAFVSLALALALVALSGCGEARDQNGQTSQTQASPASPASPAASRAAQNSPRTEENPVVILDTNRGPITVELWPERAPVTVENFLRYVDGGFFDGLIFHRVMAGFMIQGGGFTPNMQQKPGFEPISNEAKADVPNNRGTIAMARTNVIDSATSQFFINLADNDFLNHRAPTQTEYGYAVFGQVTAGMETVDTIATVPTTTRSGHQNVPVDPIIITSAKRAP